MSRSEKNKTPYKEQWQSRRTATVLGIMALRPQHREQWHYGHRLDTKITNHITPIKDKTIQHHTISPSKHQTHYGKEHKRINPNPIRRSNAHRWVRTRCRRFHRTAHRTNTRIRVRNLRRCLIYAGSIFGVTIYIQTKYTELRSYLDNKLKEENPKKPKD